MFDSERGRSSESLICDSWGDRTRVVKYILLGAGGCEGSFK